MYARFWKITKHQESTQLRAKSTNLKHEKNDTELQE